FKLGIGGAGDQHFRLYNVNDANGIHDIFVNIYRGNGALYQSKEMTYDVANKESRISYNSGFFPNSDLDEVFQVEFVITGNAGNVKRLPRQKVLWDYITNAPTE